MVCEYSSSWHAHLLSSSVNYADLAVVYLGTETISQYGYKQGQAPFSKSISDAWKRRQG
jgi:hypothetical protein